MQRRSFLKNISLLSAGLSVLPGAFALPGMNKASLFQNGDTILFIGDSITHNGQWHTFIENYYLTRFPLNHYQFVNGGISGDQTGHVLRRLETDILPVPANKVVVMLGMNNTGSNHFYFEKSGDELKAWQEDRCAEFLRDMKTILTKLREQTSAEIILVTPSPYDETATLEQQAAVGKNSTLQRMAEDVKLLARQYQADLVQFFDPMLALNKRKQAVDSSFTVIGSDRVHPSPAGHQLMAALFLQQQGVPSLVSSVELDWSNKKIQRLRNAALGNSAYTRHAVNFTLTEKALPYPVGEAALQVLDWVDLENTLNRQLLQIHSLPGGQYKLLIDEAEAGRFTKRELAAGINLAFLKATPQYRQAQKVHEVNQQRATKKALLRSFLQVEQMLQRDGIEPSDSFVLKNYTEKKAKENLYYGRILAEYQQYGLQRDVVQAEIDNLTKDLHWLNKPVPHQYTITSV